MNIIKSVVVGAVTLNLVSCTGASPSLTNLYQHGNVFGPQGDDVPKGSFRDYKTGKVYTRDSVKQMKAAGLLVGARLGSEEQRNWSQFSSVYASSVNVNGRQMSSGGYVTQKQREIAALSNRRYDIVGQIKPEMQGDVVVVPVKVLFDREEQEGNLRVISHLNYRFFVRNEGGRSVIFKESMTENRLSASD